jgi:hypothetical protein
MARKYPRENTAEVIHSTPSATIFYLPYNDFLSAARGNSNFPPTQQ